MRLQDVNSSDFIMLPKVDLTFKEIMANEKVRKGFLSAVLNIKDTDIKTTVLMNTNMRVMHDREKQSILDVRVIMNDDTEIDIEIQIAYYGTWAKRAMFYLAKMLTEQTGIDKLYSNMKKCVGINILDFRYTKDDRFYKCYHMREDDIHDKLTDVLELHIIELPKLPSENNGTALYNWAKFIKADNKEELEMIAKTDSYIGEAYKCLEVISQDKQMQIEYTSRQKALMDYNTIMEERLQEGIAIGKKKGIAIGEKKGIAIGEKKGRAEGKAEAMNEMIVKLKNAGISDAMIQEILK